MSARTPEELPQLFAEAFGNHDLEAVMELYESDATLIPQPGQVVTGTEAIREALSQFLVLKTRFESRPRQTFQAAFLIAG